MKLELKHLAPYLPYGLVIRSYIFDSPISDRKLVGISNHGAYFEGEITPLNFKKCKPILRPLYDLKDSEVHSFSCSNIMDFINNVYNEIISMKEYNYLLKNHFDVFGLIDKGLAIDINQLIIE